MTEETILVVDDEASLRRTLEKMLQRAGYAVQTAGDPEQAQGMLESERVDLAILDLQMPKLSGFGVLEELKNMQRPLPPIVVMTGVHDSHDDINIVRDMGASGFLDKSLDPAVAMERIKMILEQNQKQG